MMDTDKTDEDAQQTVYLIRGMIVSMPKEAQVNVDEAYQEIKKILEAKGEAAYLAVALIGAEVTASEKYKTNG